MWLESIGRSKYVAPFTENFETLDDLRLSAQEEGIPVVLETCGVKALGDKTALRKAIEELVAAAPSPGAPSLPPPPGGAGKRTAAGSGQQQKARLMDVIDEPMLMLNPIHGVMNAAALSLGDAVKQTGVANLDACILVAQIDGEEKAKDDPHGLSADEIGAIRMYTAESELYPEMNALLRMRDRKMLKPFFPYLHLLLTARVKLSKHVGAVWRGVHGVDLRSKYPDGKKVVWWAFSSTTKKLDTLLNPQFLGQTGIRTVFMIEIKSGVDIIRYSAFDDAEAEVLLFPGTMLEVVSSMDMGHSLYQVHLREVEIPAAAALFQ
eukprot:7386767-Prymnesium_polylepis.2